MSNEEFEEMFGNVPFGTMIIIRDWVNEHYVSKDKIRNLLPKINGSISHFKSKNDNHIVKRIKRMLEDLLEE